MLQVNAELYFKSINERHALTFLISTTWLEIINVYIFVFPFINKCLKKRYTLMERSKVSYNIRYKCTKEHRRN